MLIIDPGERQMRNRIIGLCIARLREDDSLKTFELIHKYAYEKNYGVVTYYPCLEHDGDPEEKEFDNLYMINFENLDAMIIDADKIQSTELIRKIVNRASEYNVPSVVINGMCDDAVSIVSSVEKSFEQVVRHVVENHKSKKIDLITGYKGKWNTEKLIDIYQTVLLENGIELDENRLGYGEYYGEKAERVLNNFLDYDTPDAIICANDEMAFIACKLLNSRGLKVPDDVIVTGIDGCIKADYKRPLLTTCKKNPEGICKKALEVIEDKLSGKMVGYVYNIESEAVYRESCGCEKDKIVDYTERLDCLYEQREYGFTTQLKLHRLSERLINVSQINDIANILQDGLPGNSFFCVKDSFMQDIFQEESLPRVPSGNDKFYVIADNRTVAHTWESFMLKELFPGYDDVINYDLPIIVIPVHYQNVHYGYLVVNTEDYKISVSTLERYVLSFDSTIGRYIGDRKLKFVNSELFYVNESIKQMKERDLLTGMFNSRGFLRELETLKNNTIKNGEKIILVCVDLDGLGKINDIYGHSEGDVAIQTLAKILQDSIDYDDVCTHLGSDEFVLAMHTKAEPEDVMTTFFSALDGRVENYNAISGKEYSLEINETYLSIKPSADVDMKNVLDEALGRKRILKQNKRSVALSEAGKNSGKIDEEEYKLASEVITGNRFKYAFQPIVSAKNGEIVAYEALMRTDTTKFISPLTILKYATMDNRLYEIEYATFFNVLEKVKANIESLNGRKVFINSIPGFQLNDVDYKKLKRKFKDVLNHIVVEITEQTEMDDDALMVIRGRSEHDNFEVAIDDYGTGYSNTTSLLRYLPNYLKIDRMLITGIQEDPKKQHFVKSIIEFAHNNGFLALAEGVETEEELGAVIHMGADLIQGFYTAKPAFEFTEDIPADIKKGIVSATLNVKDGVKRKVYVADDEKEIFLVRLALEHYTCLVVSRPEITIVGNSDYVADIQIRVKDCTKTTIKLKNVNLGNLENGPCIDIGAKCDVTLILENVNYLSGLGIRVPENSNLRIEGDEKSELHVDTDGEKSYGIGNDWDSGVGSMEYASDGLLEIQAKGHYAIAFGGGVYRSGYGTRITKGKTVIDLAGANSVGIGSVLGRMPVLISECGVYESLKTFSGVGIGTWNGEQEVSISNALVDINGSGNTVCAIGSIEGCNGSVRITSAHVSAVCNAGNVMLIGNAAAGIDVSISKARLDLRGEGNTAVGIGSYDGSGMISIVDALVNMVLMAAVPVEFGAPEENRRFIEAVRNIKINE